MRGAAPVAERDHAQRAGLEGSDPKTLDAWISEATNAQVAEPEAR